MDYERYLMTDMWRNKAEARLEIDGHRCQMCGCQGTASNPLQVHHLTYHNLYHESVDKDLVTLCKSCHMDVHKMMNRVTNSETGQRGWKDSLPYSVVVTNINAHEREVIFRKDSK